MKIKNISLSKQDELEVTTYFEVLCSFLNIEDFMKMHSEYISSLNMPALENYKIKSMSAIPMGDTSQTSTNMGNVRKQTQIPMGSDIGKNREERELPVSQGVGLGDLSKVDLSNESKIIELVNNSAENMVNQYASVLEEKGINLEVLRKSSVFDKLKNFLGEALRKILKPLPTLLGKIATGEINEETFKQAEGGGAQGDQNVQQGAQNAQQGAQDASEGTSGEEEQASFAPSQKENLTPEEQSKFTEMFKDITEFDVDIKDFFNTIKICMKEELSFPAFEKAKLTSEGVGAWVDEFNEHRNEIIQGANYLKKALVDQQKGEKKGVPMTIQSDAYENLFIQAVSFFMKTYGQFLKGLGLRTGEKLSLDLTEREDMTEAELQRYQTKISDTAQRIESFIKKYREFVNKYLEKKKM